jgi:hypothetical protein
MTAMVASVTHRRAELGRGEVHSPTGPIGPIQVGEFNDPSAL